MESSDGEAVLSASPQPQSKNKWTIKKMWNELGCSVCDKVFRSSLGFNIHKIEVHPELTAQDFLRKGTRKKKIMVQEDPQLVALDSDSTLTDISVFACFVRINKK